MTYSLAEDSTSTGTRQAFLPGGHRTGAPGKHVVRGKAKYRLVDEQVRFYVAPPIEEIQSSSVRLLNLHHAHTLLTAYTFAHLPGLLKFGVSRSSSPTSLPQSPSRAHSRRSCTANSRAAASLPSTSTRSLPVSSLLRSTHRRRMPFHNHSNRMSTHLFVTLRACSLHLDYTSPRPTLSKSNAT